MNQLDDIPKETDKKKLILGTGAELDKDSEWFIQVPNGK